MKTVENKNKRITIKLENPDEVYNLINALDFYSRIWIGQYLEINTLLSWSKKTMFGLKTEKDVIPLFQKIREQLLPELDYDLNGSYGIYSKKTNENARISYDIQQVVRYKQAYFLHPEGGITVDYSYPLQTCKSIELPKASIQYKDNKDKYSMKLEFSDECQLVVIQKALAVKQCLDTGKIKKLFSYYTNNEIALNYAAKVEDYYRQFE